MIPYIDLHCDTLTDWIDRGEDRDLYDFPEKMADLKRLKEIGAMGQFFAIFFPPEEENTRCLTDDYIFSHSVELFHRMAARYPEIVAPAYSWEDLMQNHQNGKLSAFLSIEDGRAVAGDMTRLDSFYEMGVRCMALTWNFGPINVPNCFGYPNGPQYRDYGLTDFGKEAVAHMQELGMLVDVSHLSDRGFLDVADCTRKPFIASHSNCRSVCGHLRNLDDDMIRILADRGGVAGLNFCPDLTVKDSACCSADDLAKHVWHLLQTGGEDCIALGTDFDGIGGTVEVDSPTKMPLLFDALSKCGLTGRQLDKFARGNVMRVLKDTL